MSQPAPHHRASVPLRQDAGVIGLVGLAHMISHYCQLLLPPLFPWLKEELGASYVELGFLMSLFFLVSCGVQAASGFLVDRYGPRPILLAALGLLGLATLGFAFSASYWMLAVFSMLAGVGNGVFHPVDYTLINRKVSSGRLGHAYSFHGVTGSLGWALAPAMLVPLAIAFSWRVALMGASALIFGVLAVLWVNRDRLQIPALPTVRHGAASPAMPQGTFEFLRLPAVWMCFGFFFFYAFIFSVIQAFAPEAARQLHGVPLALAAMCLTIFMVCSAGGMMLGGFLASDASRCERVVAMSFGFNAFMGLVMAFGPVPALAVPVLFGAMGFASGIAGPSRDLLVKKSTPENASGRVYGVVYSGMDIGQALSPLVFGVLMDRHEYQAVWIGLVLTHIVLITSALNVRRARRTSLAAA